MTPKQKHIVVVLAAAAVVVIAALALFVTLSLNVLPSSLPTLAPRTETPTPGGSPELTDEALTPSVPPGGTCQWQAAHLLAQFGLAGTVTLASDGTLRFDIAYPLAPDQPVDEAAQAVWTAFDVALALAEGECGTFSQVVVAILVRDNQETTRISASVNAVDLIAFGAGELTEDELIHRVTYRIDDK